MAGRCFLSLASLSLVIVDAACDIDGCEEENLLRMSLLQMSLTMPRAAARTMLYNFVYLYDVVWCFE